MAVTLPENPRFANNWEEKVWRALDEQLGPDDLIVVGQRVTDHKKDHEIDFVVAIEGAGIIYVEVKGGNVWHDGNAWRQSTADGPKAINPVEQARGGCYALRSFVEGDQRWNQPWLRWDHAVVLPGAKIAQDFALPDCPRWKVTDKSELTELASRLRAVLLDKETTNPVLKAAGIEQLRTCVERSGINAARHRRAGTGQRGRRPDPHRAPGGDPRRDPAAQPHRGARRRRQRQDVPRARAGATALRGRSSEWRWSATRTVWRRIFGG